MNYWNDDKKSETRKNTGQSKLFFWIPKEISQYISCGASSCYIYKS